jgi:DNA replication protein DnaC
VVTLVDRLTHQAEILSIEGESYRLKESRERAEHKQLSRRSQRKKSSSS